MRIYFDTSVLVKLFVPEIDSAPYVAFVKRNRKPLFVNVIQLSELKNALALKAFRKEITRRELNGALKRIQTDFDARNLIMRSLDFGALFALVDELSARNTVKMGCRTLDVVHVAAALRTNFDHFITNDARQCELARAAGLEILEV